MLSEEAKAKKYQRDQQYLKENTSKISLVFNRRNADDDALLGWIRSRPEGATKYIKALILKDKKSAGEN